MIPSAKQVWLCGLLLSAFSASPHWAFDATAKTNGDSSGNLGVMSTDYRARVPAPIVTTAPDATNVTPNSNLADITYQSNSQSAGTLTIHADTGSPVNGQRWTFKIKSTNVQTFSWNAQFVGGTVPLPVASSGGDHIDYFGFIYDAVNSKWDYVAGPTGF